jgi:hypothetical protein
MVIGWWADCHRVDRRYGRGWKSCRIEDGVAVDHDHDHAAGHHLAGQAVSHRRPTFHPERWTALPAITTTGHLACRIVPPATLPRNVSASGP